VSFETSTFLRDTINNMISASQVPRRFADAASSFGNRPGRALFCGFAAKKFLINLRA
jgi:hypothetical protein